MLTTCAWTTGLVSGNDLPCTGPALVCFIFSYFSLRLLKKKWETVKSAGIAGLAISASRFASGFQPTGQASVATGVHTNLRSRRCPLGQAQQTGFLQLGRWSKQSAHQPSLLRYQPWRNCIVSQGKPRDFPLTRFHCRAAFLSSRWVTAR